PVPTPLGLAVPGPFHREPDLMAERLQETQLLLRELLARTCGHVQNALGRTFELQRDAGVSDGSLEPGDDVGHARALSCIARLHAVAGPEHFRAEALAQAARADLLEIGGRDAPRGHEIEFPFPLVPGEDPGRVQFHPAQDLVQGDVQDLLDLFGPVDPARHLGQDYELALALPNLMVQRPHALLVRLPEPVVAVHRGTILLPAGKICAMVAPAGNPRQINTLLTGTLSRGSG